MVTAFRCVSVVPCRTGHLLNDWESPAPSSALTLGLILLGNCLASTAMLQGQESTALVNPVVEEQVAAPNAQAQPEQGSADSGSQSQSTHKALNEIIDDCLMPDLTSLVGQQSQDGPLLRRLSLDLRGVVPTWQELDAFKAEADEGRWMRWVDRFLSDPLCDEHLVNFLDRTLMLRRSFTHVDRAAWLEYLRQQVDAETPLDSLSQQLLQGPWWSREQRASQRFYLDRVGDSHLITRDIARVFLGRDLQCAQCHDHPLVEDFRQVDYHGIHAFVSASSLAEASYKDAEDKEQKLQIYIEKAAGDAPFESVFERGTKLRTGPRLPDGTEFFVDYLSPNARYQPQPIEGSLTGAPAPPLQSRREQLANSLATRENRAFVENWANRLWALIYGQGLVQPLDMMHPDNPPSHPQLLAAITAGLLDADFRIKPFVRQLVSTDAYRRRGSPSIFNLVEAGGSGQLEELRNDLMERLAQLSIRLEELANSESEKLVGYETAREAWLVVQADRTANQDELDSSETALLGAQKKHAETEAALVAEQKKLTDLQSRIVLLDDSSTKLQQAIELTGAEDAELSAAIQLAKQRAETGRGQIAGVEAAVDTAKTARETTFVLVQQATARVDQVVTELAAIQEALSASDRTTVDARRDWTVARIEERRAKEDRSQLEHIVAWLDGYEKLMESQQEIALTQAELAELQSADKEELLALRIAQQACEATELEWNESMARMAAEQSVGMALQAEMQQLQQSLDSLTESAALIADAGAIEVALEALRDANASRAQQYEDHGKRLQDAQREVDSVKSALQGKQSVLAELQESHQQREMRLTAMGKVLEDQLSQLTDRQAVLVTLRDKVTADAAWMLHVAGLYPLTPEQLAWSTLQVTGVLDAYVGTEMVELDKANPLPADADAQTQAVRRKLAVRQAIDKLRGISDTYVSLYASGPDKTQDDFFASADQALYVANGGSVYSWAGAANNNPTQIAVAKVDDAEVARTLYWGYLCRTPTEAETQFVVSQISQSGEQRNELIHELAWSLLASAEFRFTR